MGSATPRYPQTGQSTSVSSSRTVARLLADALADYVLTQQRCTPAVPTAEPLDVGELEGLCKRLAPLPSALCWPLEDLVQLANLLSGRNCVLVPDGDMHRADAFKKVHADVHLILALQPRLRPLFYQWFVHMDGPSSAEVTAALAAYSPAAASTAGSADSPSVTPEEGTEGSTAPDAAAPVAQLDVPVRVERRNIVSFPGTRHGRQSALAFMRWMKQRHACLAFTLVDLCAIVIAPGSLDQLV